MSAAETPEQALATALSLHPWYEHRCPDELLATLRTAGWDVTRTPPDLARIREQAFAAGIAYAEARHAAARDRQAVVGASP